MRQPRIDIYGFQLPMTSFLAKIHISNARRRIRETMSTEPRDSSKLISGGPRTVLLRHRARHKHTRAEKILTFPRFRRRACARLENLWFSLNGSFLRLFIRWLPCSPKRWKKRGRKEGIYARGDVINRGSGIGEKEARAQHRRKSSTSVHLPILYLDDVCEEWIGDPGSRWIL